MNGRVYDPLLGRFLSPDPYIQMPDFTQNYNRYSYCLNNPLLYTDPSGNYAIIDDIIAAAVGGVINLATNAFQGNIHNIGDGLAAFGAGAVGGFGALYPEFGGWVWGGATVGATNAWLGGATSAKDITMGAGVGAISGVVGGAAGQWAGQNLGGVVINGFNVASPVLKGAITGAIGGAAGGYAGGFAGGLIMTGDVGAANKAGVNGLWSGAAVGGVVGGGAGYRYAKNNNINPWTGVRNNSVTIGEGMYRVDPATKDLGNSNINKDWPADMDAYYDKPSRMTNPNAMEFNGQWVEIQINNEVYIYDIGTPKGGSVTSPYYNMEVGRTMIYPNVVPVQYIHYQQTIRILIISR